MNARASKFHRLITLLALLASVLVSSSAAADNPQRIAEARFKVGLKHMEQGNFESARLEFLQAQAIYPRPSLLRNLALCELKTNRPLEALRHLRAYLGDASTTADKREHAKKNFEDAFALTGHIQVRAIDGATISVDGEAQGAAPFKEAIDVLPGRHVVEARLGERKVSRKLEAFAGIVVEGDLWFEEKPSAIAVAPPVATTSSDFVVLPPAEPAATWWTTRRVAGGAVLGLGLVVLAGGLYFHLRSDSESDEASSISASLGSKSACAGGADPRCADLQNAYEAHDRAVVFRNVSLGIGSGIAAVGAVLFLWPSSSHSSRLALTPILGASVGGVQLRGVLP